MASWVRERYLSDIPSGFSGSIFETWAERCYCTQQWCGVFLQKILRVDVTLCHERIFRKKEVFPAVACLQHLGPFRHRKFRPKKASAFDRQFRICLLATSLLFGMSHWFRWPDPLATHSVTHLPMFITDSLNRRRSMGFAEVGRYFPGRTRAIDGRSLTQMRNSK